jgi:tetratricopeptide (TPR) repeat protein
MKTKQKQKQTGNLLPALFCLSLVLGGCAHQQPRVDTNAVFTAAGQADAAYAQGHWIEAARFYQQVITLAPTDGHAWFRLGNVRLQQARYAAAVEAYQAALVREPGWTKAYYNLSTVYLLQAQAILDSSHGQASPLQQQEINARLSALDGVLYAPEDAHSAARIHHEEDTVRPSVPKLPVNGQAVSEAATTVSTLSDPAVPPVLTTATEPLALPASTPDPRN